MIVRARASSYSLVPLFAAALASFAVIGADCRWLVALGRVVAAGHLPSSLPFATAPTSGWRDAPALAELVLYGLWRALGERALVLAQVIATAAGFWALAAGLRWERRPPATVAGVSLLVLAGALPSIGIVRNGLFSVALFPLLVLLLERESVLPSRRIWLAVPLLALWTNLHGGVLVGYAVLAVYVVVGRRREAPAVLAAGALALCATPVLWHTPQYFLGVAHNDAAARHIGLWARPGLRPFDLLLGVAVLALAWLAVRGMAWRAWEAVAAVLLAAATLNAARLGLYLLFMLAWPAARGLGVRRLASVPAVVYVVLGAAVAGGLVHGPVDIGSHRLAGEAARRGGPVLADPVLAEQVALARGRVWVADPLDAFRLVDQRLYLDWAAGRGSEAVRRARLVLVSPTSAAGAAAARDPRLVRLDADAHAVLYRVRPT